MKIENESGPKQLPHGIPQDLFCCQKNSCCIGLLWQDRTSYCSAPVLDSNTIILWSCSITTRAPQAASWILLLDQTHVGKDIFPPRCYSFSLMVQIPCLFSQYLHITKIIIFLQYLSSFMQQQRLDDLANSFNNICLFILDRIVPFKMRKKRHNFSPWLSEYTQALETMQKSWMCMKG